MIDDFIHGNVERLNTALLKDGLSEELRKYLWQNMLTAGLETPHDTTLLDWELECVKSVLPYIYNTIEHNFLFVDRFVNACVKHAQSHLILHCLDYTLGKHSLEDILSYAIKYNDFETLQKLQQTPIKFNHSLIPCSDYDNLQMAQYLLPFSEPLFDNSFAWFLAVKNNNTAMIDFLQPHSHIVEAARHVHQENKDVLKTYLININQTKIFGQATSSDVFLARACINKQDVSKILSTQTFSQPVLEACCFLAVLCKNPTALSLIESLSEISQVLGHYLQNHAYRLFKYAVRKNKFSMKHLNSFLEWSIYYEKSRDVVFLLHSGMDPQPTFNKWASYNPDCIDQLLKHKETVEAENAEKQRKVLINSTLGVHTNKKSKI